MIYQFGEFELDEALMELRFRGSAQLLPLRVLRTLVFLVRNRARAVSREEVSESVWGGLAMSDASLSHTIMLARKATHDESEQQLVIKTVRGHGFRFVAKVHEVEQRLPAVRSPAVTIEDTRQKMIGRERELAMLVSRLGAAERGRGSLVLVEGAPGIGKTVLTGALCAHAMSRGAHTFWGRCWEDGGAPAFWPFTQVLRAIHERYGADAVHTWLDDCSDELRWLVPELAPSSIQAASEVHWAASQVQFRVFDALGRLLRRMSHAVHRETASAVVIALENLHAADDASIQFLRFLSSDLQDAPLLVVSTFRDLEVTERGPLAALLERPLEHTHRLTLRGLERPDIGLLAQQLLGVEISAHAVGQLHELSQGNPFVAAELARYSPGGVELSALAVLRVPERLAQAVHQRLEGVSPQTRALLDLAAVLGPEFHLAHLRVASARTQDDLLRDLEPALRAGTLEPVAGSAGARLRFAHALVRDTLYGDLPLARRLSMHRAVAEALEAASPHDVLVYDVAHHFYLAAPAGLAQKAADYARRAAAHAFQVSAFDTAASLRDRALELASGTSEAASVRAQALIEAGDAWFYAGEFDRAIARYESAAEHARAHSDATQFALAVLLCVRALRGFTMLHPRVVAHAAEALAMLGSEESALKAMMLALRGIAAHSAGDPAECDAATREAVEMAERSGTDFARVYTLMVRRWRMAGILHPRELREIADKGVSIARNAGNREGHLNHLIWRMDDHLALTDLTLVDRDLREYFALASLNRHVFHQYWAEVMQASRSAWAGDLTTATDLTERAFARGRRIREPSAAAVRAMQLWQLRSLQGRPFELTDELLAYAASDGAFTARVFKLYLQDEPRDCEHARREFDDLARHDFTDMPSTQHRRVVLAALSAVCVRLDDRARARRLYDLLLPDADLNVFVMLTWIYVGPVSEYLAGLAACMRDSALAARHFEVALAQAEKMGARALRARIQYQYAHALRATSGSSATRVAALLQGVQESADELGTSRQWPLPGGWRSINEE